MFNPLLALMNRRPKDNSMKASKLLTLEASLNRSFNGLISVGSDTVHRE
jgi:hypothetical protein